MSSALTNSAGRVRTSSDALPYEHVRALLDTFDKAMLVVDRQGRVMSDEHESPEMPGRASEERAKHIQSVH